MAPDKKKIYIISAVALVVLLLALFAPVGMGRPLAAVLLLPTVVAACLFIKKRNTLSLHSRTVLLLMAVLGALYLMAYYVSALFVGLTKTGYGLKLDIIVRLTLPIGVIIVCTELIRYVLCAQQDRYAMLFAYCICLLGDVLIYHNLAGITIYANFMEVIGLALLPGMLSNALYNYLSRRYGWMPNLIYRLLTVWVFYLIPYGSAISNAILAFVNIILPIAIYLFIDALYEKKRRYALGNRSVLYRVFSTGLTVVVVIIMAGTMMLVSNHFRFGAYVIATPSMTGELNKGDVAIYERYDNQPVEGKVIVFKEGKTVVVHRVVDMEIINGVTRYYTKGDANEDRDAGYITDSQIIGVVDYKLPFVGYPTIWVRNLFKH